jgi:hypothetical protein
VSVKRLRQWWSAERGSSAVTITILAMPFIIAAFGFGFDSLRFTMVRSSVEGSATAAAVAAATATRSAGQQFLFDVPIAQERATRVYYAETMGERGDVPGASLSCPAPLNFSDLGIYKPQNYENARTLPPPVPGVCAFRFRVNVSRDAQVLNSEVIAVDSVYVCNRRGADSEFLVTVSVQEEVPMTFMRIVGVDSQWLSDVRGYGAVDAVCDIDEFD